VNLRSILWIVLAAAAMDVHATSNCYQWWGDYNPGTSWQSGWVGDAQAVADSFAAFCNSRPFGTGTLGGYPNSSCHASCNPIGVTSCVYTALSQTFSVFPTVQLPRASVTWTFSTSGGGSGSGFVQYNQMQRTNPIGCKVYVSALTEPRKLCGESCNAIGDPIDPASASVSASETDYGAQPAAIEFKRFYGSADSNGKSLGAGWRHSFSRSLRPVYSSSTYKAYTASADSSSLYADEALACTNGFAQIKSRVDTWANAIASYSNGVCTLTVGGTRIGRLPIYYTSPPTPAPGSTVLIGYDATRDDGQLISLMADGGVISAPPSSVLKLQSIAGGYVLTGANDATEAYDTGGRLLSITKRAGVIQTMSYDTAGRLSTVTDSFGHQLVLTYDSESRLSTVTRQ
jgi:YD repeat-containing protein